MKLALTLPAALAATFALGAGPLSACDYHVQAHAAVVTEAPAPATALDPVVLAALQKPPVVVAPATPAGPVPKPQ